MTNKELYKHTFSQIHASEDKIMEVINMKDTAKKRKIYGKKMLVIAACAACLMSVGVVANAATDGELGKTIVGWFVSADGTETAIEGTVTYDENGNKITEAELENGGKITTKENADGSREFTIDGGDSTDSLVGIYSYSQTIDGDGGEDETSIYVIEDDSAFSEDNDDLPTDTDE